MLGQTPEAGDERIDTSHRCTTPRGGEARSPAASRRLRRAPGAGPLPAAVRPRPRCAPAPRPAPRGGARRAARAPRRAGRLRQDDGTGGVGRARPAPVRVARARARRRRRRAPARRDRPSPSTRSSPSAAACSPPCAPAAQTASTPPIACLGTAIAGRRDPFVLVLDDAHVLASDGAREVLDAIIGRPPAGLARSSSRRGARCRCPSVVCARTAASSRSGRASCR